MFLSDAEIAALTRRSRTTAQKRELDALGIPYRTRTDGSIVVLRRDVESPPMLATERPRVKAPA